jgi:hypothetical protein
MRNYGDIDYERRIIRINHAMHKRDRELLIDTLFHEELHRLFPRLGEWAICADDKDAAAYPERPDTGHGSTHASASAERLLDPPSSTEGRCKTQCGHGSKIPDRAACVAPQRDRARAEVATATRSTCSL